MKTLSITKIFVLLTVLLILSGQFGFAQVGADSGDMAIGAGLELNMNTSESFALALVLGFNYNLELIPLFHFAVGGHIHLSMDFKYATTIEAIPYFRWYVLRGGYTGVFAQVDLGFSFILEETNNYPMMHTGLRGGYRMPIGDKYYVEAFARFGYPFFYGIGVIGGMGL